MAQKPLYPSHPSHHLRLSLHIPRVQQPPAPKYGFQDESVVVNTTFTSATALHKNQLIILKSRPCRIVSITSSLEKPCQHHLPTPDTPTIIADDTTTGTTRSVVKPKSVTWLEVTGKDIFSEQALTDKLKDTDQVQVPINVLEEEYLLVDVEGGKLVLWGDDGVERNDVKIPDEGEVASRIRRLVKEGKEGFVRVRGWNGEVAIVGLTETDDGMFGMNGNGNGSERHSPAQ